MKLIGVYGGTFDPVHRAHVQIAREILQHAGLDHVRMIPCYQSPFRDRPQSSDAARLAMLHLATDADAELVIDERELSRQDTSFTVDTLKELKQEYPEDILCLIVGDDAFAAFTRWHNWQEILQLAHVLIARRPGYADHIDAEEQHLMDENSVDDAQQLTSQSAGLIHLCPVTQLPISATAVRTALAQGEPINTDLDENVKHYIEENGLYQ